MAEKHYRKPDGTHTSELAQVKQAMRYLKELYAETPAADFGPLALKAVRDRMIARDIGRGVINSHAGRIKHLFRWAVSNEMVPLSTYHGLCAVMGLQEGRCDAREAEPVKPVDDATIKATLPKL